MMQSILINWQKTNWQKIKWHKIKSLGQSSALVLIISIVFLVVGFDAAAVSVSYLKRDRSIPSNAPVHVMVVGYSGSLGSMFFQAATARAKKYAELYPNENIVMIASGEKSQSYYRSLLKRHGWNIRSLTSKKLSGWRMMHHIKKLPKGKVRSLNIFAHTALHKGAGLDKNKDGATFRFKASTEGAAQLQPWFSQDAYVFLHGCNSGYKHAPEFSQMWNLPVAGSFGATDFQTLRSDDNWYYGYKGFFPEDTVEASSNRESYNRNIPCSQGSCIKLNPANQPYSGYWGKFNVGLGIFKFFCRLKGNNAYGRCTKAMARSLYGYIDRVNLQKHSSLSEFRQVVIGLLCPPINHTELYTNCVKALAETEATGKPAPYRGMLWGRELKCDLKSCDMTYKCNDQGCDVKAKWNPSTKTITQEYLNYLHGFKGARS